jgi:hypothetical protein
MSKLPQLSDRTLAEQLARRLRGARVFQLFARRLGPGDVVYVSALAWDADENIVEAKASAMELEQALLQLLSNLDTATAPED